jgi:hypothetical protein
MSANKRPSTSSLRRFITSRPYVTVADIRRRFGLDDPDAMARIQRNGTSAWIGLPDREATKLQELWHRDELGLEMSVEVRAPVVVGLYPIRIARYVTDAPRNGHPVAGNGNGALPPQADLTESTPLRPNPLAAAPDYHAAVHDNGGSGL